MTSSAARWLSRSSRYVEVSPEAGAAAARWLVAAQHADGSWEPPRSRANSPHLQQPVPLTAHALVALLETKVTHTGLLTDVLNSFYFFVINY